MRKITFLEIKEIQSENFDWYVKYEDKLFFSKVIIEVFRHKFNIYSQSRPYNHKWYHKCSGNEVNSTMGYWLDKQVENKERENKKQSILDELETIKI